jgi:ABC-2 type transport system permease protein
MMPKWLRSYGLMLKWDSLSMRTYLALMFAVQLMIAAGFIYGISFFYPAITPETARYLTSGAPTLILATVGLVVVPQSVAMMRQEGTFDYIWSLPVPRMVYVFSFTTVMLLSTLPGVILAIGVGAWNFNFDLSISFLIVPAVILVSLSGTFVGYAMALSVSKPMMVNVLTQIIVFVVMLFSPVMFPVDRLPGWLQDIHQVLPIQYMAELVRGTLTDLPVNLGLAFGVVGAWCALGFGVTWLIVRRRR